MSPYPFLSKYRSRSFPRAFVLLAPVLLLAAVAATAAPQEVGEHLCGTTDADLGPISPKAVLTARPPLAQAAPGGKSSFPTCMTSEHIFFYEDTNGVLAREHTGTELQALRVEAANALIAQHGDNFDYIGFWTNFEPGSRFGGAHYNGIRNDVEGIGKSIFDNHATLGLDGSRTQAFIMMYDFHIKRAKTAPNALAHEFAHRWVVSLRPMADGRSWGGGHFNCRVDQQGGTHGADWVREDPARPKSSRYNTDTGDRFSYLVLYLAGYVTAEEMDAGMAEQRYMDDVDPAAGECLNGRYFGPTSPWSSADIIATNGVRVPAAGAGAQTDFTAAWVLFYQPGEFPHDSHINKLVRITENFHEAWPGHTIGRGTLYGQLFPDMNCDGQPD